MEFIGLIVGFVLLIKGADWMVESASNLAKSFGVSTMIVGLTVVAIGTSMPEAAIGVMSAINHANQLTLGDVIGSSVANIALIIGVAAIIRPLIIQPRTLSKDLPLSLFVQIIFVFFLLTGKGIDRVESVLFLIGFICFLIYLSTSNKGSGNPLDKSLSEKEPSIKTTSKNRWKDILLTLIGMVGVVVGSKLVVDNSIMIATSFGLSETMIGITIVALGTSLPELVVSIVSVSRKEHELMVGNIIGSNIFNVLLVIGLSASIYPVEFESKIWPNLVMMLLTTVLFLIFARHNKRISRKEGALFLCFYLIFLFVTIMTV